MITGDYGLLLIYIQDVHKQTISGLFVIFFAVWLCKRIYARPEIMCWRAFKNINSDDNVIFILAGDIFLFIF